MFQVKKIFRDVTFSNDGKKMFVIGNNGDDVDEYTLSKHLTYRQLFLSIAFQLPVKIFTHLELGLTMMDQKCLLLEEQIKKYLNIRSL